MKSDWSNVDGDQLAAPLILCNFITDALTFLGKVDAAEASAMKKEVVSTFVARKKSITLVVKEKWPFVSLANMPRSSIVLR